MLSLCSRLTFLSLYLRLSCPSGRPLSICRLLPVHLNLSFTLPSSPLMFSSPFDWLQGNSLPEVRKYFLTFCCLCQSVDPLIHQPRISLSNVTCINLARFTCFIDSPNFFIHQKVHPSYNHPIFLLSTHSLFH